MENTLQDVEASTATIQDDTSDHQKVQEDESYDHQTVHSTSGALLELPRKVPFPPGTVEPYISDVKERWELAMEFCRVQQQHLGYSYFESYAIAVFMLSPIPRLRQDIERATSLQPTSGLASTVACCLSDMREFMGIFEPCLRYEVPFHFQRAKPETSAPGTEPAASLPLRPSSTEMDVGGDDGKDISPRKIRKIVHNQENFDTATSEPSEQDAIKVPALTACAELSEQISHCQTPAEMANARDGNRCILTGEPEPDAVAILPVTPSSAGQDVYPTALLHLLSGPELRRGWEEIFRDKVIDEPQRNLLSFSKHMHKLWDECYFALKPVSATEREVTVQLHWLKFNAGQYDDDDLVNFDTAMQAVCDGDTESWGTPQDAHLPNGDPILTGQLFTIRADSPDQLPNTDLLHLQWFWRRMYAMTSESEFYGGIISGHYFFQDDDDVGSAFR
ncbi:hypothetical protein SEPCBS57363_006533 [Sporothrix epigloea]|uniref:HNH nuclease domain-containing protein n=1 Tax=Sporothrix epigloea TaxID=1892477 RepID=A0ABP0E3X8_9PEZI